MAKPILVIRMNTSIFSQHTVESVKNSEAIKEIEKEYYILVVGVPNVEDKVKFELLNLTDETPLIDLNELEKKLWDEKYSTEWKFYPTLGMVCDDMYLHGIGLTEDIGKQGIISDIGNGYFVIEAKDLTSRKTPLIVYSDSYGTIEKDDFQPF